MEIIIIIFLLVVIAILVILLIRKNNQSTNALQEYESKINEQEAIILNLEEEKNMLLQKVDSLETQYSKIISVDNLIAEKKEELNRITLELRELTQKNQEAAKLQESLKQEVSLLKDDLEIADFGVYEPQFDYETSDLFKLKIKEVREKQKQMIKEDTAVRGGENWSVNGSAAKGKAMIKKQKKLMLRAFNGECDNFISGVKWNNETRMEGRIAKSVQAINKMGESQGLEITKQYAELKLLELKLTHEYNLKKYEEKEQQRLIREQMREEEKARRDFERAKKEAQKEEEMLEKAMKKAREQIGRASEEEKIKLEAQLAELQVKLQEAEEKNKRAISMAQQTKAGHVYVISNIGSFGENVYKIGMTRRLNPLDRVHELGDASVPFRFDVHAMIYSDNAPELENSLHKAFDKFRLNHVNRRREYFNISLQKIEELVIKNHGEIEFIKVPEAKEYRESLVIRQQLLAGQTKIPKQAV